MQDIVITLWEACPSNWGLSPSRDGDVCIFHYIQTSYDVYTAFL